MCFDFSKLIQPLGGDLFQEYDIGLRFPDDGEDAVGVRVGCHVLISVCHF
jgi:hypothetical protein